MPRTGSAVSGATDLDRRLRLLVLTQPRPECGRRLEDVVSECLEAGCRAIQLRDKNATAAELHRLALELRARTSAHDALLFINDRVDVALAAGADGVHLGPGDIPVHAVRRAVERAFLIGYSTDDPAAGRRAAADGADYLGVGAVYGTTSKAGLEDEAVGPERVGHVRRESGLPCVGIGGITPLNVAAVAAQGAGVAVLGAVMQADRPGEVVRQLLDAIDRASPRAETRSTRPG